MELQEWERGEGEEEEQRKPMKNSHFKMFIGLIFTWEFLFEFTILLVHPPPYVEVEYNIPILDMLGNKNTFKPVKYMLSDFLFAFMFLRVYFVVRTLMNFSPYSEMHSKRICAKY